MPAFDRPESTFTQSVQDHPEYLITLYGEEELVDTLDTLGILVLLLVTSWERAVDPKKQQGCLLLGKPGFGCWTQQELDALYDTFS